MTKLIAALLTGTVETTVERGPARKLETAADIRVFVAGRTITHVAEPLDDHVRFVFTDGSSLLVVTAGREVGYYAEPVLLN